MDLLSDTNFIGGLLGLLGVIATLIFSYNLNKQNKEFQKESDYQNRKFQKDLNEINIEFQQKLSEKDEENKLWFNKYNILIQLISYRFDITTKEYTSAINGIPAVFHDSKNVMRAIKNFFEYTSSETKDPGIQNEKMIEVYIEIFKDLGIDKNVDEVFLNRVFHSS